MILLYLAGIFSSYGIRADHPTIAFGSESGGPINTIATDPLPQGTRGAGIRTEFINFDKFSDTQLENFAAAGIDDVHSADSLTNTSLSLAYGVSNDFTVSARIGYVERQNIREGELEMGVPEAHNHGDSSGVGDLVVLGQYRFLERKMVDVSLLGGIKAPTGKTNNKDGGEKLEIEFQPGTGSWDYLFGASASVNMSRTSLHGNMLYNLTTEGDQDTEIGNAFFYNLGITYTFLSAERHAGDDHTHSHIKWDAILELNGESRDKDEINGLSEDNSGGDMVFLSPGMRLTSDGNWSLFLNVGFPVHENLNGVQTDVDYRVVGGIGIAL